MLSKLLDFFRSTYVVISVFAVIIACIVAYSTIIINESNYVNEQIKLIRGISTELIQLTSQYPYITPYRDLKRSFLEVAVDNLNDRKWLSSYFYPFEIPGPVYQILGMEYFYQGDTAKAIEFLEQSLMDNHMSFYLRIYPRNVSMNTIVFIPGT